MADEVPLISLNIMFLTFDTFYLIRDDDVNASRDTLEFVLSDPTWFHDATKHGYTKPRVPLGPDENSSSI
jgi:hypothetical protein